MSRPLHHPETLGAYLDDELSPGETKAFEHHVAQCRTCAGELRTARRLRSCIRRDASYHRPDVDATARLSAIVADYRCAAAPKATISPFIRARRHWIPALAAAAACLLLIWNVTPRLAFFSDTSHLADEVVDDHLRALTADHLTDLTSSDSHSVKPWLAERVDAPSVVENFAKDGFALLGGRLDRLEGRTVAALAYRHEGHVIDVFALPEGKQDFDPVLETRRGYALVRWACEGVTYWAVSDTDMSAIADLARLVIKVADAGERG